MSFGFNVKQDVKEVTRYLNNVQKKQIPFATSLAINDTLFAARKALMVQAPRKLDRPTPFTVKGFQVQKSKKSTLSGYVFIEEKRQKYMLRQIEGGTVTATGRGKGVPTKNKNLNRYGNIPGKKSGLVKGKRQFIATIKGITGVWERHGRKGREVKLLIAFEKSLVYKKRFPFHKIAEGVAKNTFINNLKRRLAYALRTAR